MSIINVYDFDNTIYNGESMLDFYFFCMRCHPSLIKFVFVMLYNLIKYKLCLISEEKFMFLAKKYAGAAVRICPDAKELAQSFWASHSNKLGVWYGSVKKQDDVIVSASFGFLLEPAMELLGIKHCVCSQIDLETSELKKICFGKKKVECFNKEFPHCVVQDFYTDSMNDAAFMRLASGNVYLVKKGNVRLLEKSRYM